jgi:hypothetical protein
VVAASIRILLEPFDGPFGKTFAMADPDGYRITIYEKDQPLFWPPKSAGQGHGDEDERTADQDALTRGAYRCTTAPPTRLSSGARPAVPGSNR